MTSVLTILSKSTTGTQHPDPEKQHGEKDPKPQTKKIKKTKYKSRILNKEMLESELDQLIVLQPRRNIAQSSSNVSSKHASDLSNLTETNEPRKPTIKDILKNNNEEAEVTEAVLEKYPKRVKKLRILDEPETMAAEIAKKDDNNIYNFFVDLLETTISVCNLNHAHESSDSLHTAIEIEDAVIKKLDIKNNIQSPITPSPNASKYKFETDNFDVTEPIVMPEFCRRSIIKPRIKAKSFINTYTKAKSGLKSKSFDHNDKYNKKQNKKDIIKLLKEELQKEDIYNEPENLFEALKVMAKNSRRNEKTTRFHDEEINKRKTDLDCMFERKKVISFGAKKKKTHIPVSRNINNQNNDQDDRVFALSKHSLEVIGYDYIEPAKVEGAKTKLISLNYHSSPSVSGFLDDDKALCYHLDSLSSDISRFNR
ncbi:uncharacterized protein LOC112050997 [Bicyclus anynana]|uniref:Uncharacterized protein LOC112050997 n=1 Tax=Bicyclus anynana TaxID=110368 RepID=A0A6J1NE66_BICAN|nr:uncharacterized protein LOC112050997 [Bicyclus anynana]